MMSDYKRTMELVEAANSAAGASSQQYEKTMESLETKLAKLKNAWDEFTMSIANSTIIKGVADFATFIVSTINKVSSVLPSFIDGMLKIGVLAGTFKVVAHAANVFEESVKAAITSNNGETLSSLQKLKAGLKGLGADIQKISKTTVSKLKALPSVIHTNAASFGALVKTIYGAAAATASHNGSLKENTILALENALANGTLAEGSAGAAIAQKMLAIMTGTVNTALLAQVGIIAGIAVVVGALVALIIAGFKEVNDSAKLDKINQSIKTFENEVDETKNSLEELADSKSKLADLNDEFLSLAKGTREWRQALIESNKEVLELIRAYPELMDNPGYVQRDSNGLLSISNEGWDAIITSEEKKLTSLNQTLAAENMRRLRVETEASAKQFRSGAGWVKETEDFANETWVGRHLVTPLVTSLIGGAPATAVLGTSMNIASRFIDTRGGTDDQYAKLASTIVQMGYDPGGLSRKEKTNLAETLDMDVMQIDTILARLGDNFTEFAGVVDQNNRAIEQYNHQFISSVVDDSDSNAEQVQEVLEKGGTDYEALINEEYDEIGQVKDSEIKEYAKANNMSVTKVKKQLDSGDLEKEDIKNFLAANRVAVEAKETADNTARSIEALKNKGENGRLISSLLTTDGRDITAGQLSALEELFNQNGKFNTSYNNGNGFSDISKEMKLAIEKNYDIIVDSYKKALGSLERTGIEIKDIPSDFSVSATKGISEKLYQVALASGGGNAEKILGQIRDITDRIDPSKISEFSTVIDGIDWTDTQSWAHLEERIKAAGIAIDKDLNVMLTNLANEAMKAANAIQKIDWDKVGTSLKEIQETIIEIQNGTKGRTFTKEEYERIKTLDYNEAKNFREDSEGNYVYTGTNLDNIVKIFTRIITQDNGNGISILQAKADSAGILYDLFKNSKLDQNSGERTLRDAVGDALRKLYNSGVDISSLGISGLTDTTDLEIADAKALFSFYEQLVAIGNSGSDFYLGQIRDIRNTVSSPWTLNPIEQASKANSNDIDAMRDLSAMGAALGVADSILSDFAEAMDDDTKDLEAAKKRLAEAASFQITITQFGSLTNALKELGEQLDKTTGQDRMDALQAIADEFSISITKTNAEEFEANYRDFMNGNFEAYQKLYAQAAESLSEDPQMARKLVNMGLGKGVLNSDGSFGIEAFSKEMFASLFEQSSKQDLLNDLMTRIYDAIVTMREKAISKMEDLDKTVSSANKDLADSMKKVISQQRQARTNDKTQQSIADKQRRLMYLQMDTTGANAVEAERLQREIADEQQSYQDSLLDQKLAKFEEDNNIAQEQRQEQIEIMKQQLENDKNSGAIWTSVMAILNGANLENFDASELFALLKEGEGLSSMSPEEQQKWISDLKNMFAIVTGSVNDGQVTSAGDFEIEAEPYRLPLPSRFTTDNGIEFAQAATETNYNINIGTINGDGNIDVNSLAKQMEKVFSNAFGGRYVMTNPQLY